jgi:carboxylesterase
VFIVGMSMGALLGLTLAAEEEVDALVAVGTPLRFSRTVTLLVPLAKRVRPFLEKSGGSDIRDDPARARHPGYKQMPLASVHELVRLQQRVEGALARIFAPILIAHGELDRTANPANAREIFDRVSSVQKQLLMLEESGHVCPVDFDGAKLAAATAEFLTRFL